jgi:polar amino acid transport system substrate-binding protein
VNRRILVTILLALGGTTTAFAQEKPPLRWGGDEEGGAPYVFRDKDLKRVGFEVDLVAALEKELGRKIAFTQSNFDSLIPELLKAPSEIDFALNGLEVTEARQKEVLFTLPYYIYRQQLVARVDEKRFQTWRAVREEPTFLVGTMDGTEAAERLAETIGAGRTKGYPSPLEAYADLRIGNIDAVVMDLPIAIAYARPDPDLKFVGQPFWRSQYAIAFRPDNKALAAEFNAALKRLLETGKLQNIYQRWGLWNGDQLELLATYGLVPESLLPTVPDEEVGDYQGIREGWPLTRYLPLLLGGAVVTIELALAGFALAVLLGLLVALARLYGPSWLKALALIYVEFFRGIPVVLLLLFLYFGLLPLTEPLGLPAALKGMGISPAFAMAVLGLGLNYAAYEAEIYRAGIGSVPEGQWEAAASLGMTRPVAFRRVILPQAMRTILPPMTGDFVALFKDTSIASFIAVVELNKQYQILAKSSLKFLEIGLITAILYLVLSVPLGYLSRHLEEKWSAQDAN